MSPTNGHVLLPVEYVIYNSRNFRRDLLDRARVLMVRRKDRSLEATINDLVERGLRDAEAALAAERRRK